MKRPAASAMSSEPTSEATRVPTCLTPKLDKHLLAYATAASAAGVSLFLQSAQAKVVYTAAHTTIGYNQSANLDLTNDGTADFVLNLSFGQGHRYPEGGAFYALMLYPAQTANEIWGVVSARGSQCAAALPSGVRVGAGAPFQQHYLPLWDAFASYTRGASDHCPWSGLHRGAFVGLKFVVNSVTHYGWAHVTLKSVTTAVLDGYAYETVPNQAIDTGKTSGPGSIADLGRTPLPEAQPATLGMLAQGSRGLDIWRRPDELSA